MNYYEELGIRPDADQEEIRKAHRRLVRLVHPDQHRDPATKQLAETQMRRLNSIVATLLDAARRHEYDEQLRASLTARPAVQTAWRKVPWWIASTAGAVILTVGAVWFLADHLGSSFSSRPPVEIAADSAGSATAPLPTSKAPAPVAQPRKEPKARITATVVPSSSADRLPGISETPKSSASRSVVVATVPVGERGISARVVPSKSPAQNVIPPSPRASADTAVHEEISSAGSPAATAPKPEPVYTNASVPADAAHAAASGDPAEGEWIYSPKEPERRKPGFYPPAYISLTLRKKNNSLRGQYNARYEVTDNKPISPDVSFQLTAVDKTSRKFVWEASNGSRGTLAIRSVDGRTMRLEWRTTVFTGGPALTSGIATLERREP
jgi:hypothetical protein